MNEKYAPNQKYDPFSHIGEPKHISGVPEDGPGLKESMVYEYTTGEGKKYIRKQVKDNKPREMVGGKLYYRDDGSFIAESLEDLAQQKKRFYEILKKYLGDYLVDTHYVIAADNNGEPQINIVQEKVSGMPLFTHEEHGLKAYVTKIELLPCDQSIKDQLKEIDRIFREEIQNDKEIEDRYSDCVYFIDQPGVKRIMTTESPLQHAYAEILPLASFAHTHVYWDNIMITPEGKVRIIDW